jgi:DNA-binding protein WhiA
VSAEPLVGIVRAELAAIAPARRCDRLAEVSALFHTAGALHLRGRGTVAVHLDVAASAIARRAFALLASLRVHAEIRTYRQPAFGRPMRFQLHVDGDEVALGVLEEAGVLDAARRPLGRPPGRVIARECCRGAYLRGAFLGSGSLSGGAAPHLEIRTPTHAGASFIRSVASVGDVRLRVLDRDAHSVAYAKAWAEIEGYLVAAGAIDTVLSLEERAVVAELRAEANRLANADHANLVRTARAAREQLAAVDTLRVSGALELLPDQLREAAALRVRYPSSSLRELAARADPPATKAALQRRLARIVELATGS